jgi:hypothetical protein
MKEEDDVMEEGESSGEGGQLCDDSGLLEGEGEGSGATRMLLPFREHDIECAGLR